ncbi:hypothetical protein QYF61_020084 [Mycteria americana]|uniref:Uncharacterized protein n=1 Tax=Mycteria americana TaxID=33587 RepID=A0AAN7N3R6_MYCAM|nr:hypothetical protein QYF61_020084 [Mycteria americana]
MPPPPPPPRKSVHAHHWRIATSVIVIAGSKGAGTPFMSSPHQEWKMLLENENNIVLVQINRVHGLAQAWLRLTWRLSLLKHSSGHEGRPRSGWSGWSGRPMEWMEALPLGSTGDRSATSAPPGVEWAKEKWCEPKSVVERLEKCRGNKQDGRGRGAMGAILSACLMQAQDQYKTMEGWVILLTLLVVTTNNVDDLDLDDNLEYSGPRILCIPDSKTLGVNLKSPLNAQGSGDKTTDTTATPAPPVTIPVATPASLVTGTVAIPVPSATGTAVQPGNQPVSVSVTPIHKKKSWKRKSAHLEREDERAGPSQGEEEEEVVDEIETTQSLSLSEMQGEHVVTWLLQRWDSGASSLELEGKEAKQLGSLSREGGIYKAIGKGAPVLSLWRQLLTAMKERYPLKEDVIYCPGKWTTMERGIQYLRELAMLEVIYGDLDDKQLSKDPDEV